MNLSGRIYEIDLVKFFAALIIVSFHLIGGIPRGFLFVELFFLISGFFVAKSLSTNNSLLIKASKPYSGLCGFLFSKIKVFYPELFISTLLFLGVHIVFALLGCAEPRHILVTAEYAVINNLMLLRMSGISYAWGGVNAPAWYLSSMLLSLAVLYPVLKSVKNPLVLFASGGSLLIFLICKQGGIEKSSFADSIAYTYGGNIRALSGLLLGAGVYYCVLWLQKKDVYSKWVFCFFMFFKCILYVLLLFIAFNGNRALDAVFVVAALVLLLIIFSRCSLDSKFFNIPQVSKICSILGKMSLPIYLGHYLGAEMNRYNLFSCIPKKPQLLLCGLVGIVVVFVGSWGLRYLACFLRKTTVK